MKALLVDDSRAIRMFIGRIMTRLGFEVIDAPDGRQAMDLLDALAPDELPTVALIDWNMPVMDGLSFVSHVRARSSWRDIALMMVTTESEQAQIVRALAAGAHEYLIKPFTEDALASKLGLLGVLPAGAGV